MGSLRGDVESDAGKRGAAKQDQDSQHVRSSQSVRCSAARVRAAAALAALTPLSAASSCLITLSCDTGMSMFCFESSERERGPRGRNSGCTFGEARRMRLALAAHRRVFVTCVDSRTSVRVFPATRTPQEWREAWGELAGDPLSSRARICELTLAIDWAARALRSRRETSRLCVQPCAPVWRIRWPWHTACSRSARCS